MNPIEIDQMLATVLHDLRKADRYRLRRPVRPLDAVRVEIDGKQYVNFASNDYLGLTHHPAVIEAVQSAVQTSGWGSGAAPLVSGYTTLHADAEKTIAAWKGTEDAVLLSSGFQANQAIISAMAALAGDGRRIRFLLDKLCHASLIDAVRSSKQWWRTFPHNDIAKLRGHLQEMSPADLPVVITESIFSMDGEAADLPALAAIKRESPFVLLLDEAHGTGVYGPVGRGLAAEMDLSHAVDLSIVTLSKALGGMGGAICGSRKWCEMIVNLARPYIFSTAVPAPLAAAAIAAIGVIQREPQRQQRVRQLAKTVRSELSDRKMTLPPGDSPIIPIILGSETTAVTASKILAEQGLLVPAIRPPTVAKGTSRLRITLSCEHSDEQVGQLLGALREPLRD